MFYIDCALYALTEKKVFEVYKRLLDLLQKVSKVEICYKVPMAFHESKNILKVNVDFQLIMISASVGINDSVVANGFH